MKPTTWYQNLYHHRLEDIQAEFETNAQLIQKRKNGNILYHEILSITKAQNLSDAEQKALLKNIASRYAQHRAEHNLVFGTLHDDHDAHLHYHLLISANAVGESKKTRLSKTQFDQIKKDLEQRVLKHHPELEQATILTKKNQYANNKQGLVDRFEHHARTSTSKTEFLQAMEQDGFIYYKRGNTDGFKIASTGKKHRLSTLGLSESFTKIEGRIHDDIPRRTSTETKEYTKSVLSEILSISTNEKQYQALLIENNLSVHNTDGNIRVYNKNTNLSFQLHDLNLIEKYQEKQTQFNKNKKSSKIETSLKEVFFGDFEKRDQRIKKEHYQEQNKQDAKIVKESDRTFMDKTEETIKEWVQGDFSHREARQRNEKKEAHLKKWKENNNIEILSNQELEKKSTIEKNKAEIKEIREQNNQGKSHSFNKEK